MHDETRVDTVIKAPPAKIWDALTDPRRLKQFFFGSDVVSDWAVGGPIRFRGEWKGKLYEDKGDIADSQPWHGLTFTHWSPMSGVIDG